MLVNKLLASAVRLWLKSQISASENLKIKIKGRDKEILQGYIPEVFLTTEKSIYQGIHFSQLSVKGTNIKFNLPQVLKKQPLKLLEPIVVKIEILLLEADFKNSLASTLFASGLTDLWSRFLNCKSLESIPTQDDYNWQDFVLLESGINLKGIYKPSLPNRDSQIGVQTNIRLQDTQTLLLLPQKLISIPELPVTNKDLLLLDLGEQVTIKELIITAETLEIKGTITIFS